ncbi:MAG: DUF1028 domain-containing protein [Anaerolineales bacterium]|nr:DUF1028 domain-containing protein [Anaerolineales bacterium]
MIPVSTFSIVAFDPICEEWGVAVQSKFLGVGAVVPWAKAHAGAVATQSFANLLFGPQGLELMGSGKSSEESIQQLIADDNMKDVRQVGMVDKNGRAAAFTGKDCYDWAGHIIGDGYSCQGNILIPGMVEAMAAEYEQLRTGTGELADWLVASLAAGQKAGGDSRGRQSAAVLVVREGGGYGGNNDRYLDLRVDDHSKPIQELQRILNIHHLYFSETKPEDLIPIHMVTKSIQSILHNLGYYSGIVDGNFTEETSSAFLRLVGIENLEEKWKKDDQLIDKNIINYLLDKYSN